MESQDEWGTPDVAETPESPAPQPAQPQEEAPAPSEPSEVSPGVPDVGQFPAQDEENETVQGTPQVQGAPAPESTFDQPVPANEPTDEKGDVIQ